MNHEKRIKRMETAESILINIALTLAMLALGGAFYWLFLGSQL